MWHVAERVWRGGGGGGETGHGLADVWNAKCVYDLWHVLCQINQMQSTVSAGLTELIRHVVPSPSLFPLPVPCTARGCCCCPLCQILDTCPDDTWTTSMKIQFPVENALTNQLFCVYSKYTGIFQARQHWYPVSRLNLPGISYQLCTIFLYFSSRQENWEHSLSVCVYCKCIWDCPSRCWCWFWLLCLGCFSYSLFFLSSPLVSCFVFRRFPFEFSLLCVVLFRITYRKTFF